METPLEVDFESLEPSTVLIEAVRREVRNLERLAPRLLGCHVVVRQPHRHRRRSAPFEVRIHAVLPGGELAVTRGAPEGRDDAYRAVRDAFVQLRRQLREFMRVRQLRAKGRGSARRGALERRLILAEPSSPL